jgi:hypothetical protein
LDAEVDGALLEHARQLPAYWQLPHVGLHADVVFDFSEKATEAA